MILDFDYVIYPLLVIIIIYMSEHKNGWGQVLNFEQMKSSIVWLRSIDNHEWKPCQKLMTTTCFIEIFISFYYAIIQKKIQDTIITFIYR